jgi:LCP family protein required for cell wall assembly
LVDFAVHGWVISLFKLAAFALGLAWVVLLIDAWRLGRPPTLSQPHRLIMLGATVGLAVLVMSPFVFATRYATAAHDAVVEIFPSSSVAAASDGRLNILLLGNDAGKGRNGVRPDSITLASIDARTGQTALVSLPRNLEKARFPNGTPARAEYPRGFKGDGDRLEYMLNATWTFGDANPDLFPDADNPGAEAVKQAVAGTLDMDVHYFVTVDLAGFKELIDSVGGITVRIENEIPIGQKGEVLEPGVQELDGYEALWYARSRTGTSDYDRMARQRCVLGAFVNEVSPSTVAANFTEMLEASESVIETDIPASELSTLVDLAMKAKSKPVASLQLVPPLITPADPDLGVIRDEVDALIDGKHRSPSPTVTIGGGTDTDETDSRRGDSDDEDEGADENDADDNSGGESTDIAAACSYD